MAKPISSAFGYHISRGRKSSGTRSVTISGLPFGVMRFGSHMEASHTSGVRAPISSPDCVGTSMIWGAMPNVTEGVV